MKTKPAYFYYLLLARGLTGLKSKCSAWKGIKLVKSSNLIPNDMVKCGGFMGGDLGWEGGHFLSQLIKSEPPTKPRTLEKVFVVVVVERDFSIRLWPNKPS